MSYAVLLYRTGAGTQSLGPFGTEAEALAARDAVWGSDSDVHFAGIRNNEHPNSATLWRLEREAPAAAPVPQPPPPMAPRECRRCEFAQPSDHAETMECRRSAPFATIGGVTGSRNRDFARSVWPDVDGDDWCGEFKPRRGES